MSHLCSDTDSDATHNSDTDSDWDHNSGSVYVEGSGYTHLAYPTIHHYWNAFLLILLHRAGVSVYPCLRHWPVHFAHCISPGVPVCVTLRQIQILILVLILILILTLILTLIYVQNHWCPPLPIWNWNSNHEFESVNWFTFLELTSGPQIQWFGSQSNLLAVIAVCSAINSKVPSQDWLFIINQ